MPESFDFSLAGTVRIEGGNLVFEIHGIDEILAIKREVSVPLDSVVSVSTEDVGWQLFQQLKVGGANIPGVVKDGRFLSSEGLMFFEMHHPDRCITVTLSHDMYKGIVFEVDDKEQAAKTIRDALAARR